MLRICERLLTSWLFWLVAFAIGLSIGVKEAFFPKHVPETTKIERSTPDSRSGEQK
jgi:hypothetical protein